MGCEPRIGVVEEIGRRWTQINADGMEPTHPRTRDPRFPSPPLRYNRCIGVYLLKRIRAIMREEAVRWSIKVSKDTDLTLRTFLGAQGAKKGDLSKFIEEAVRWRVLHRTVQDIRERNADADPDELQRII